MNTGCPEVIRLRASVFLSYAHEDLPTVIWEADSMRLGGLEVFLDSQSLRTGVDWPQALIERIHAASRFVLYWSKFCVNSDWVRKEYTEALSVRTERGDDTFLQVNKLDETPLPEALEHFQYLDRSREALLIVASDAKKISWGLGGLKEMLSAGLIQIEKVTPRTTRVISQEAAALLESRGEHLQRAVRRKMVLPANLKLPAWALCDQAEEEYRPLILIPTLMGSNIGPDGTPIWINYLKLAMGGMDNLRIERARISPISLVNELYRSVIEHVKLSLPVLACPYDWRLSFQDSAHSLAELVNALLSEHDSMRPSFVAHGAGSFVVRALAAFYPDLWKECMERGARIIFVGAPENGSYSAAEFLTDSSSFLKMVALLDLTRSSPEVMAIFRGFPSFWELLPQGPEQDLLARAFWENGAYTVDCEVLVRARDARTQMARSISSDDIHYVYGNAHTISRMTLDGTSVRKVSTSRGDGLAPYELSFPGGLPRNIHFVHGFCERVLDNPIAVRAIVDLACHGDTSMLPTTPQQHR